MSVEKNLRPVSISITGGSITKGILVGLLFYVLYLMRDLVLVVLTAVVVASAIEPLTKWFARHRIKRVPAVLALYVILGVIFVGVVYFFLPLLVSEVSQFMTEFPRYADYARLWFPLGGPGSLADSANFGAVTSDAPLTVRSLITNLSTIFSDASEGLLRTVSAVFGGVLSFILIVVLSFYLAVQEDGIGNFLRLITPNRHEEYIINLWRRSQLKIGLWMQGQLLLGLIVGVLVFLGLLLLGVKQALFLAVLAALFELIPLFGPILSAIPAILIALTDGGVGSALLVAGLYLIIQQFENHLIYPQVVKNIVGVSPIIVIIALIVGGKLAGFLGVILSVPVASAFMEYLGDVERGKHQNIPDPR